MIEVERGNKFITTGLILPRAYPDIHVKLPDFFPVDWIWVASFSTIEHDWLGSYKGLRWDSCLHAGRVSWLWADDLR